MFKLKNIIIIALIVLTLGIAWRYYKKYKESEKLKIGEIILKPTQKISKISDVITILQNGLNLEGFVEIRNFSGKDYTLNQISLDCFTPTTDKVIAEQTNIIQNDVQIKTKQVTNIPLKYKVDILNAISLLKECGVIPTDATVWSIIANPVESYNSFDLKKLKIKLKGFIQAEGINLSINEVYPLYE